MAFRDLTFSLLLVSTSLLSGMGHDLLCLEQHRSPSCFTAERFEVVLEEGHEHDCLGCHLGHQRICLDRAPSIQRPDFAARASAISEVPFLILWPGCSLTNRGPPAA